MFNSNLNILLHVCLSRHSHVIKGKVRERQQNAKDASYYAIGRKWKKSLDILLYRASMSESHYVPASKKVKCRQTIRRKREYNGMSETLLQYYLQAYLLVLPLGDIQ